MSYGTGVTSTRKETGSYYTPVDVTHFFWNEFFALKGITDKTSATNFCTTNHFVEPAVGAGALFFGLLHKFVSLGVEPKALSQMHVSVVDINRSALEFVESQLDDFANANDISFANISFLHDNFLSLQWSSPTEPYCVFGNPPFVSNKKGESEWKNLYADFLEAALNLAQSTGNINMIVPLSLTFSRDYAQLRNLCKQAGSTIQISNFDNIPDALFKSGKPESTNTNKANSQRCSIISIVPCEDEKVLVSPLMRWFKAEREIILKKSPSYIDITDYRFDDQLPRPSNSNILSYLRHSSECPRLENYISDGPYQLHIGSVARNYISIRSEPSAANHTLTFKNENDFILVLSLLVSDVFFEYWKTLGDGFHVTKKNLYHFPVHPALIEEVKSKSRQFKQLWRKRENFQKSKLNKAKTVISYDFRNQVQLSETIRDITTVRAAE